MKNRSYGVAEFSLCAVFAAALSACGGGSAGSTAAAVVDSLGGGGSVSAASVGVVNAGDTTDTTASSADVSALAAGATGDTTTLAAEGKTFAVSGTQVVQYGSGDNWISKSVVGGGTCSNDYFGFDPRPNVAKSCQLVSAPVTTVAAEGAAFSVAGTTTVQYGVGSTWVSKTVTGSGTCSNGFFGSDPAYGVVKSCQVTAATIAALSTEGNAFTVSGAQVVQYGLGDKWVTKRVSASGTCSNAFFGDDPAQGTAKVCQLATTPSAAIALAAEGKTFSVSGTQVVQYGAGTKWASKTVTGAGTCSNAFFGGDPAVGVVKSCQIAASGSTFPGIIALAPSSTSVVATPIVAAAAAAPATTVATAASLMPTIDLSKLPAPVAGQAADRIMAANVADPSQNPVPGDIGAFREPCAYSHMSYDDPIVYPGTTGAHLHTFFGNTGANAKSTTQSLATSGNSTCAGGTLNRTAYWVPTMIDTKDGTPLVPTDAIFYYKQGYHYVAAASIKPLPAGLKMIAGDPTSKAPQSLAGFTCQGPNGDNLWHREIPPCPVGTHLVHSIAFPQCWDGVNLDSPDHRSHMAYAENGCPSTHPVALPEVSLQIAYAAVSDATTTTRWRLSSDNYDKGLPGGYSAHADWFNGWNADVMKTWVTNCINKTLDCHAYLTGDGRMVY